MASLEIRSVNTGGPEGQTINNQFNEAVIVIREFWKMSESQQQTLMSEGISHHIWEKCPLAGHSVFFMTRAWEIGRMSAYGKNYASTEDKVAFQESWMRRRKSLAKRHSSTIRTSR